MTMAVRAGKARHAFCIFYGIDVEIIVQFIAPNSMVILAGLSKIIDESNVFCIKFQKEL